MTRTRMESDRAKARKRAKAKRAEAKPFREGPAAELCLYVAYPLNVTGLGAIHSNVQELEEKAKELGLNVHIRLTINGEEVAV